VEDQVVVIFAGTRGYLDKLPVDRVGAFEKALLSELKAQGGIIESIRNDREIKKDVESRLVAFLDEFTKRFSQN
jgi:F-type H+-transporting ATPase subunit alpha